MKSLRELLSGWVEESSLPALVVSGLNLDSRQIQRGEAFVAIAGEQGHGLKYASQARRAGAVAVLHDGLAEVPSDLGLCVIEVPQLGQRLSALANRCWQDPANGMDLVAVTGTNGKTSVAWLLAQALGGAMIGTLGIGRPGQLEPATHTTPDVLGVYRALARIRQSGIRQVVLEASSHALSQGRLEGLSFTTTIFTNLGHDHLDYHLDFQAYGESKARLFTDYPSARQLINVDDAFGRELTVRLRNHAGLLTFGLDPTARPEVFGEVRQADLAGLELAVSLPVGRFAVDAQLIGQVNASNLLIVAGELHQRGLGPIEIGELIEALEPVPGRMNCLSGPGGQVVIVDYAHSPDALERALGSLRELCPGELWCVFGCGGDRDRAKRPRMGQVAESLADWIVLTDDNPRSEDGLAIIREIQTGMARPDRCRVIRDRAAAIHDAIARARRGDVVLVAGKGHETVQIIGDQRHHFSDFEAVAEALEQAA